MANTITMIEKFQKYVYKLKIDDLYEWSAGKYVTSKAENITAHMNTKLKE